MSASGMRLVMGLMLATTTGAVLLAGGTALAKGCDAVPEEYRGLENRVSVEERGLRYWQRQFKAKCARCHGERGDGGGKEAADLKVPPADFTDAAFMAACSDGQLFYQIENGGGDKSAMPAFGPGSAQAWGEEKIWGMVAFLRTFAQ